jgi:hypothetical protein
MGFMGCLGNIVLVVVHNVFAIVATTIVVPPIIAMTPFPNDSRFKVLVCP